jgi:hypothetical protein
MRRNRCVRLIEIQVNNSKPFNTNCVYDSNFFLQGVDPNIAVFFDTHFLICHSFLDSHIVHDLARKAKGKIWRETWGGRPGWNSRTVAQYPKPSAQSRSHVTTHSPPKPPNTKIPHFQFPTMLQEN